MIRIRTTLDIRAMGYLFMKSTMGKEGGRVTKFGAILQKMIVDGFWGGGVFV